MAGDAVAGSLAHDLLGNSKAAFGGFRNAGFVEAEADQDAAVLRDERQNGRHGLGLAVDGIDERLAVHASQRGLQRGGVRGVELERQVEHGLEFRDDARKHGDLVHAGEADIDVEDIGAGVLLLDALVDDVGHVAFAQGLLEALLACRVDAFADDGRGHRADLDGVCVGGDDSAAPGLDGDGRDALAGAAQRGDVRGGRAAASAEDARAAPRQARHFRREILRPHVIDGTAVHDARHAGVGLDHDGRGGGVEEGGSPRLRGVRAETAVEAERIDAEPFEQRRDGGGVGPGKKLAALVERHCRENGQIAVFARGEYGGLELVEVGHRLDDDEVGAGGGTVAHLFGEGGHGVLEVEVAERREEAARGADVESDEAVAAAGLVACSAGVGDGGGDELGAAVRGAFADELDGVGAKGVGEDEVRARLKVRAMDGDNLVGVGEVPFLGNFAGAEAVVLEQRAHAAVGEDDSCANQREYIHGFQRVPFSQMRKSAMRRISSVAAQIAQDQGVVRKKTNVFGERLGDKNPVEGVAMIGREPTQRQNVVGSNREPLDAEGCRTFHPVIGDVQLAERALDFDFPSCRSTDEDSIGGVGYGVPLFL